MLAEIGGLIKVIVVIGSVLLYSILEVDFHQHDVQETNMPTMRPLALVENKYIDAWGLDGEFIIDFHAAHERVMYERLKDQMRFKRIGSQNLLAPISLELSKSETKIVQKVSTLWLVKSILICNLDKKTLFFQLFYFFFLKLLPYIYTGYKIAFSALLLP